MKRIFAGIISVGLMCAGAHAQEQTPDVLLHAAQCLSEKNFLSPSKTAVLSFGYLLDSKSYPGERVLYVVRYTRSGRSHGEAFTVFLSKSGERQVMNIQNNAIFIRNKNGVAFTNGGDPLGGAWTQQHLVAAIKQIEGRTRYEIAVGKLRPSGLIRCEAYTDKQ